MHNSATIISIAERNTALFSSAPANENHEGYGEMFANQCKVEAVLSQADACDIEIEERRLAQSQKFKSVINQLIECGRA